MVYSDHQKCQSLQNPSLPVFLLEHLHTEQIQKYYLNVRSEDLPPYFLMALLKFLATTGRLKSYFRDKTFLVYNHHVIIKLQRNS